MGKRQVRQEISDVNLLVTNQQPTNGDQKGDDVGRINTYKASFNKGSKLKCPWGSSHVHMADAKAGQDQEQSNPNSSKR